MPLRLYHITRMLPAVLVLLLLCTRLSAQQVRPAENIALLDSLATLFSTSFARDRGPDTAAMHIAFSDHPAAARLRRMYAGMPTGQHEALRIQYYIADFGIRYFAYDADSDSLVREAALRLSPETTTQKKLPNYHFQLRDTIARSDLPFVESNQFDFGRAPIPDKPSDFYSDIAEPLVVVSAAVITILLLFTVRSQ